MFPNTSLRTPRCGACAPFLPAVPHYESYGRDPSVVVGAYDRIAEAVTYDKEDGKWNKTKSVALIGEACLCRPRCVDSILCWFVGS